MAEAVMSHHWDIAAPIICYLANPNLPKKQRLKMKDIHPYYKKKKRNAGRKPFDHGNWEMLKGYIKRGKS